MMKQDYHVFQGMEMDKHPIRHDASFLFMGSNVRFTSLDGMTSGALVISNERGTKDTGIAVNGFPLGYCVLQNHLVVFTLSPDGSKEQNQYIYDITEENGSYNYRLLYQGDLGLSLDNSCIQTLGVYESNLVQKVYWVDGVNSPRVINIVADKLLGKDLYTKRDEIYPKGCFDFIQELELNEDIEVTREEGGGSFSAGTMQYAFSYYYKYGQESNLFYSTELLNVSFKDRGGSPEDNIANTFHITISNVETKFDYLRIYSIHRTSLDATPTVKLLVDLEASSSKITYVDTGTTGTTIDPTRLLYIGGESIIAGTITEKDNTLFLGNIKLKRTPIGDAVKKAVKNYQVVIKVTDRQLTISSPDEKNSFYSYCNHLPMGNISTFQAGDTYRLGLQFQYKTGKWSEPVWVTDYKIPDANRPAIIGTTEFLPCIQMTLPTYIMQHLDGYKKVRPLIVFPSVYDRTVLAQGVLCPTVFSIKSRLNNSPFAQSSWFFRPMSSENIDNSTDIDKGATVAFGHLSPLLSGKDRGAEIQNMTSSIFADANSAAKNDRASSLNTFFIDHTILTMHSPDIEFNDSVKLALDGNDFDLNIVGVVPIKSNAGDISIQTSSAVPAPDDTGFFHKTFLTTDYSNKGMVAGMFYKSHIIDDTTNAKDFYAYKGDNPNWELNWLVYPWHRTGSLNNDITRPEGEGTRTSVLKRKVISNLRFSPNTAYLETPFSFDEKGKGITKVSVFDSNEVSLIKIPTPGNSGIEAINYYGNVDSLITTNKGYTMYVCPNEGVDLKGSGTIVNPFTHVNLQSVEKNYSDGLVGDYKEQLKSIKDPVRMKYKSSPHAVFALNYNSNTAPVLLPKLTTGNITINEYTGTNDSPFWSSANSVSTRSTVIRVNEELKVTKSGSQSYLEEYITNYLNNNYKDVQFETFKICQPCSVDSSNEDAADLYVNYGNNTEWSKVDLSNWIGTYFRVEGVSAYYWKVTHNNEKDAYVLQKVTANDVYEYKQETLDVSSAIIDTQWKGVPLLLMAELRRKETPSNMFGGTTQEALKNNLWIPAGKPVNLGETITFTYGDTYYQRYDCLKTYPFTTEDENSVVEIASFMCETRTNIDGRYDRNRGQLSNLNMSPTNFNLLNPVYSQKDNFFNYRILDDKYYKNITYPTQILWSQEKTYLEDVDTWTNITLASSLDLNGAYGAVTSLETFNDTLIAFQKNAINQIMFNSRVQMPTSDGVPIEISNNYKVEGTRIISDTIGCEYKSHIAKSPLGIYFIDNSTDTLYLYNGQIQDISNKEGMKKWFIENHSNREYIEVGIRAALKLSYDSINKDLYISPPVYYDSTEPNTLCYSEKLGHFTSFMFYDGTLMFPMGNEFMSLKAGSIINSADKYYNKTRLWVNFKGDYNKLFDTAQPFIIGYVCNEDPTYSKVFDTIEYRMDVYDESGNPVNASFNYIMLCDSYQQAEGALSQSRKHSSGTASLRKKFNVWRAQIPRESGTRNRMRDTWCIVLLGGGGDDNCKYDFHDISTKYTI